MAATPILSRLFTPEAFGVYGVIYAILTVLTVAASFGYPRAIVSPKEEGDASSVFWLSTGILILFVAFGSAALWTFRESVGRWTNAPEVTPLIIWVGPALLAAAFYEVLEYWSTRRQRFGPLSTSRITRSLGTVVSQIGAGLWGFAAGGLVGGLAVGKLTSTAHFAWQVLRPDINRLRAGLSWGRIWEVARRYKNFPRYSLPANVTAKGGGAAVPIVLSIFFGSSVVGLYWFTQRLISAANDTIGRSVRQVFCQRASEIYHQRGALGPLFRKNTILLTGLAFFPVAALVVAGPDIFALVFGEPWREAGAYVRWLILPGSMQLINWPALEALYVLGHQKWQMYFEVLLATCRVGSVLAGGMLGDPLIAIVALSVSVSIVYAMQIGTVGIIVLSHDRSRLRRLR